MDHSMFVGLDVHKKSTSVALAEAGRGGEVRFHGEIPSTADALRRLVEKLAAAWAAASLLLRGWPLRLWRASVAAGAGPGLYRGRTVADPEPTWRSGEDEPPRCFSAGQNAPSRRVDGSLGA